jgi:hypothetical protein
MKTDWVVIAALLGAVLGMPQTASAAGSYGAVVEKGMRGCTTDPQSETVICFESPGVSLRSRDLFLEAWRAAHVSPTRRVAGPATLYVLTSCVRAERPPAAGAVPTYLAGAAVVAPCAASPTVDQSPRPARLVVGP